MNGSQRKIPDKVNDKLQLEASIFSVRAARLYIGGPCVTRTRDLIIRRDLLYPSELRGQANLSIPRAWKRI
jgi:hypothetical protein